ncbi:MAG: hypothetical protein NTV00_12870, partial [Methylococcales bacterium]|nr:hypothetical protein [Methylococcales bacterium]
LKRDDGSSVDPYDKAGSYPKISQYDHMYLLNEAGKFDGALIDVIDPCFGTSSTVTIGTGTPPPGSTKNYLVAISSPLQRDGAADATKPCGSGSVILKKPGPVLEEDSAAATTTNTVGNTTSSTTSTTKKVPTTQEWIAVLPNSDDQYTFKVTRTGVSPLATKTLKDEAVYNAATGVLQVPKVRVVDRLYSVQLQQAPTAKSTNSAMTFGIVDAKVLNQPFSADPYLSTFNKDNNNVVKLPKVTIDASKQAYSVDLRLLPNNTLEFLSATPLK